MSRLMHSPAMHLAQLDIAWPEWSIVFSEEDQAYIATLRTDPGQVMAARHLATLEGLLMTWDKARQ